MRRYVTALFELVFPSAGKRDRRAIFISAVLLWVATSTEGGAEGVLGLHRVGESQISDAERTTVECCYRDFSLADPYSGRTRLVWATSSPVLALPVSSIERIDLTEIRDPTLRRETYWGAFPRFQERASEQIREFLTGHMFDTWLVTINGQAMLELPTPTTSVSVIAVFFDRNGLYAFAESISKEHGIPTKWVPFDEEYFREIREKAIQLESDMTPDRPLPEGN